MTGPVAALTGGVGGAKLVLGLAQVLDEGSLSVIVNTGDDFQHLGLSISPDIDTLIYTLSGLADPLRGWGRRDESWNFMAALERLGGETWFRLGDADLAMHVERSRRLAAGEPLSRVTDDIRLRLGVRSRVLPMTDDTVRTRVKTTDGWMSFQDYFVRHKCAPRVEQLDFSGADAARALPEAIEALVDDSLRALVICPSNPYLSIDPILAIPALHNAVQNCPAPVIAVSPIIGGQAVKGPTAKMMAELGSVPSAETVLARYAGLIDAFVVDEVDAGLAPRPGIRIVSAPTLMTSIEDRRRLARTVLAVADELSGPEHVTE